MKKKKGIKKFLIPGIIILAIIVVLATSLPKTETHYYYDKVLGTIKIDIIQGTWLSKIFGSVTESFFDRATAEVGNSVQVCHDFSTIGAISPPGRTVIKFAAIYITGQYDGSYEVTVGAQNAVSSVCITFNPSQVGTYNTHVTTQFCDTAITPTCEWKSLGNIASGKIITLTVTAPPISCPKTPSCDEWAESSSTDGGKIFSKLCRTVNTATCTYTESTSYETRCDNGYTITGSTDTIQPGQKTCTIVPVIIPNATNDCTTNSSICISPQVCKTDTKTCIDPVCDVDKKVQCLNGENVTTHTCLTTGVFLSTNLTCPTNDTNKTVVCVPVTKTCDDNLTIITVKGCVAGNLTTTTEACPGVIIPGPNYLIYIGVGGVILIMIVVIFFILKSRKR